MQTSLYNNISTISSYTDDKSVKESLKGSWYKFQSDFIRVTILKDLVIISSDVADVAETINIELPTHGKFYVHIDSASGTSCKLVEAGASLSLTLEAGQSVSAIFNYK